MALYTPKTILVTGGAGFIGSHYVDHILEKYPSVKIITLDALTYAGSLENLNNAQKSPRHTFVHGNILDRALIQTLLEQHEIDTIVHFAAESHVDRSINGPAIFIETNVMGTHVLLEAAREFWLINKKWGQQQCRFHMISTDEVYGSLHEDEPAFTEQSAYKPSSPYAASKAAADHLVNAYAKTYGLPVTLSHCSNNYGPRQHTEKLIPTVIRSCMQKKAIPVYGNGLNRRDWIHVLDHCVMVDWIIHHGRIGESYNLGANCEWKNRDLIHLICKLMDKHHAEIQHHAQLITFVTDRAGHDFRYAINSQKAISEGCPMPQFTLESTLSDMIHREWVDERNGATHRT